MEKQYCLSKGLENEHPVVLEIPIAKCNSLISRKQGFSEKYFKLGGHDGF